jgi:hypothetical protein
MKRIILTKGYEALVDDDDYETVNRFNWHMGNYNHGYTVYAKTSLPRNGGEKRFMLLHNFIMQPPDGFTVDHIDKNGLNCQRNNMRFATKTQQVTNRNAKMPYGYRGIRPIGNLWETRLAIQRKVYRNSHETKEEAAKAYDKLAKQYHGEFASLNFPEKK